MMRVAIVNFTGGEMSATLSARYDLTRYSTSARVMQNFIPNLHGDCSRRPGTRFLADLGGDAVLVPFSFSSEASQNFVLVFGEKTLRIADRSGILPVPAISTPYLLKDLPALTFSQVGDVVYLAHRAYPFAKVMRFGAKDWRLQSVTLNSGLAAPSAPVCTFKRVANGDVNDDKDADINSLLRYKLVALDANGKQSLPSPAGQVMGKHPSDWLVGNYAELAWGAVPGACEYNVYREEAGYFGFIGVSAGTSFRDNNFQADLADTPQEDWNPFANGNNPGVVSFHQQRMVLAATPKSPQAFYMSRVGDFENFRKSRPLQDDDPVEYLIASGSIDSITWAASFGDLLLGTSGSEYKATGEGQAITSKNITITAQSYWGSANLLPIVIGNSILHIQRHGSRVRDLFYSLEKDGYAGNDLSIMAPHLFDGYTLRQWCYQQTPGSTVWVVRSDGVLLALTYMKEHDIWGWTRHVTAGHFRSICAVSGNGNDECFVVVQRSVGGNMHYYLERLEDRWTERKGVEHAFYVDCGISCQGEPTQTVSGLAHLEGATVSILADGSPVEGQVVTDGAIHIPYPACVVQVGLPYTSVLSPMPVESDTQTGTTLGRMRAVGECSVRLHNSVGGQYGTDLNNVYSFNFVPATWGEPVALFTGDIEFNPHGGMEKEERVYIVQTMPLPFNVAALTMNIDLAQN